MLCVLLCALCLGLPPLSASMEPVMSRTASLLNSLILLHMLYLCIRIFWCRCVREVFPNLDIIWGCCQSVNSMYSLLCSVLSLLLFATWCVGRYIGTGISHPTPALISFKNYSAPMYSIHTRGSFLCVCFLLIITVCSSLWFFSSILRASLHV